MKVTDTCPGRLWELCLLVAVLAVAACVRFYGLDQNGLSASELSNLAMCDIHSWLALVDEYAGNSGMPPLYPTLLCQFTAWTSHAEFFVRTLSALANVAMVYVTYLIGKEFLSSTTGLFAAALLAASFQAVLASRDATLYTLFAFLCVLHSYYFCKLVLDTDKQHNSLEIGAEGQRFQWRWAWEPAIPCDARILLGFWVSGILAFYTNPVALLFFCAEWLAAFLLVEKASRRQILASLWLPILVAMVPWVPVLYNLVGWVVKGNLLGVQPVGEVAQKAGIVLLGNPMVLKLQVVVLCVSASIVGILCVLGRYETRQRQFLGIMALYVAIAIAALGFIKAIDFRSLLYGACFIALFMVEAIAFGVRKIPWAWLRFVAVLLVSGAFVMTHINANTKLKIYTRGGDNGFNDVAQIISSDASFMSGSKIVFTSSDLFDHYLEKYDITSKTNVRVGQRKAEQIKQALDAEHFYMLEYRGQDKDFEQDTPDFSSSVEQYRVTCITKLPRFRVARFSRSTVAGDSPVINCRDFMSVKGATL